MDKALESIAQALGIPLILFSRTNITNRATAEEAVRNIEPRMKIFQSSLTTQLELFFDYMVSLDSEEPIRGAVKVITKPILVESQETISANRSRQLETLTLERETLDGLLAAGYITEKEHKARIRSLVEQSYPLITDDKTRR